MPCTREGLVELADAMKHQVDVLELKHEESIKEVDLEEIHFHDHPYSLPRSQYTMNFNEGKKEKKRHRGKEREREREGEREGEEILPNKILRKMSIREERDHFFQMRFSLEQVHLFQRMRARRRRIPNTLSTERPEYFFFYHQSKREGGWKQIKKEKKETSKAESIIWILRENTKKKTNEENSSKPRTPSHSFSPINRLREERTKEGRKEGIFFMHTN